MRALLVLAGLLFLALAALFWGSAFCARADERAAPPREDLRRGLADPAPAPLGGAGEAEDPSRHALGAAPSFDLEVQVVDELLGEPLAGARVLAQYRDAAGSEQQMEALCDAEGRVRFESLAATRYRVAASHTGFWQSLPQEVEIPQQASRELRLDLLPAAVVRGLVRTTDGSRVGSGLVRLEDLTTGRQHDLPVGGDDRFGSALPEGTYRVSYRRHDYAEPDPGVVLDVSARLRQTVELEITLERPGAEALPGRVPGIRYR